MVAELFFEPQKPSLVLSEAARSHLLELWLLAPDLGGGNTGESRPKTSLGKQHARILKKSILT